MSGAAEDLFGDSSDGGDTDDLLAESGVGKAKPPAAKKKGSGGGKRLGKKGDKKRKSVPGAHCGLRCGSLVVVGTSAVFYYQG